MYKIDHKFLLKVPIDMGMFTVDYINKQVWHHYLKEHVLLSQII